MNVFAPEIYLPILGALIAGGVIGFEREFRARAAGFRTHTLVCVASALLMLAAVYQTEWIGPYASNEVIRIDPVRMAHGILTGIGFLCGGVIFREGASVHGLTTAASLWMTSALGTLFGVGMYAAGAAGTVLTLLILTLFRLVDVYAPGQALAALTVRYRRGDAPAEDAFEKMLGKQRLRKHVISHRLVENGAFLEYATTVKTIGELGAAKLAERLRDDDRVVEYAIEPRDG
jgi:putative Mg2+ transporter-C (MgtC) family protein